ncbi:MAG: outer membrane beta-barrel protein [Pseudomonadales bacterium]|jgi:outer membrane receptor protein involved in Fe transport|nr:outer membrane beta-barrel protein [Pseudomonadales bacterium]
MKTRLKPLIIAILLAQHATSQAQDGAGQIEEFVTTGRYIPDEKRATAAISNVLDAEAFQMAGDSNVAEGLKRIAGLNLQGGKFVYIRGLGERYSSTELNGSTLPSPEPINRVVPLDLFPATIIDSVLVQKTFSAQFPAEFAGGVIEMRTKAVPEENFLSVSASAAYSGGTTGKNGLVYSGGADDWTGFDRGARDMPDLLKNAIAGNRELRPNNMVFNDGFTPEELEAIGESLPNNYSVREEKIQPDAAATLNFGAATQVGAAEDIQLGLLGNFSYSNSWDSITVSRNSYAADGQGTLSPANVQNFRSTEHSLDSSLFLTAGAEWHENSLKGTLLQIHKADDLAGNLSGMYVGEDLMFNQYRLEWIEQDLLSQQIDGEHVFPLPGDLTLNWHYNESRAKREAPDMREYRYERNKVTGDYQFSLRGDGNTRMWSTLEDQNKDLGFTLGWFMDTPFGANAEFTLGMNRMDKNRNSTIRRFSFLDQGGGIVSNELRANPSLDAIINPTTIGPGGYQLREQTRPTDNYTAAQRLDAWFVEADIEIAAYLRLLAGVRNEKSAQNVETFDLFNQNAAPIESQLDSDDLFPALTATYILDQYDMQLRASYSKTISRPDFRELSPSPFTHPVTGFVIVGNPALTVAYIKNYDLRWEWYLSQDESISIGVFYKQFQAPIEAVIRPGTTNERSFINAEDAATRGIELDAYHWFGFIHPRLENFFAAANVSLIDSQVSIDPANAGTLTNPTRRLQGQADYIANLQLGFDDGVRQRGSLVYHITGEKIREVGILGQPDVMDQPYGELDFTYSRQVGEHLELTLKLKNLSNELQETTQGGLDVNSYREGRSGSIGFTYTF